MRGLVEAVGHNKFCNEVDMMHDYGQLCFAWLLVVLYLEWLMMSHTIELLVVTVATA